MTHKRDPLASTRSIPCFFGYLSTLLRSVSSKLLVVPVRLLAYALGIVALLTITFQLLGIPVVPALQGLTTGMIGNHEDGHWYAISESLVKMTPLLLAGLGVLVAWRAGMFSIGGEGQLLMGALAATVVIRLFPRLSPPLLTVLMLCSGILAGALWGGIAGWLKVRRNVQEVISTIMLNYLALYLVGALVNGPLQEHLHISPQSEPIPDPVLFARLIPPSLAGGIQTRLHSGILIALGATAIVSLYLYRTAPGFQLRVMGQNPEAARVAGFQIDRLRLRAMLISGGLCGLAGVVELLGVSTRLDTNFSPGWGYTAIPIALLGSLDPLGTLVAALGFGGLTAGCGYLSRFYGVSPDVINIIQAAAVLTVVGGGAWRITRKGSEAS